MLSLQKIDVIHVMLFLPKKQFILVYDGNSMRLGFATTTIHDVHITMFLTIIFTFTVSYHIQSVQ